MESLGTSEVPRFRGRDGWRAAFGVRGGGGGVAGCRGRFARSDPFLGSEVLRCQVPRFKDRKPRFRSLEMRARKRIRTILWVGLAVERGGGAGRRFLFGFGLGSGFVGGDRGSLWFNMILKRGLWQRIVA